MLDDEDEVIALLTDLLHFCHQQGHPDFDACLQTAKKHLEADLKAKP
jgi:hypothetical protein